MRRALLVAAICACSAPAAQRPRDIPRPRTHRTPPPPVDVPEAAPELTTAAPRPDLDLVATILPGLPAEARWPLGISEHPMLEPHFPIAGELAEPGITWFDLCRRGAQNRIIAGKQDLVHYLRAWCVSLDHHEDDALELLAPLLRSEVRDLPAAVRVDIASLLVGSDADRALHLMKQAQISDVETADILTAFYIDSGQIQDALEMYGYLTDLDRLAPEVRRCHRIARHAVVDDRFTQRWIDLAFKDYVDATCERLREQLSCMIGVRHGTTSGCSDYFDGQKDRVSYEHLVDTYAQWPSGAVDFAQWSRFAHGALDARPVEVADELAVTAIEAMQRTAACDPKRLETLDGLIRWASSAPLAPPLAMRLHAVSDAIASCSATARSP